MKAKYKNLKELIELHYGTSGVMAKSIGLDIRTVERYKHHPERINARTLARMRKGGVDVNDVLDIIGEGNEDNQNI